ncbi:MAG TPA: hypothetical protein VFP10_01075, partial [Candidatus Eisenbacteria bacterium]|nr:hypothetical protein [Candidatus Eisenbacteria bacterium]
MKSPAWTRVMGAAALLVFAGCAWFREPPGAGTPDTPGPKPMIALKTLPDTSEAPGPSPITPTDTTRAPEVVSPPPVTPPDLEPPPPQPQAAEPFFTSPEGTWNLSGQTLTSETGPEGQVTSIQAPVITHGEVVITATRGSYFVDKEQVDMQGNVRFRDRKLTGRAPHAIYYRIQELLVADGGFVVDSDTLHLEGREGTYDREQDVVFVRGDVKGVRGGRTITSNEAEWFRGRSEVFFRGNAVVVDPEENTRLSGERIRYDLDEDRAEVMDSPRLVISTNEENPIDITGDRLRTDPEGNLEARGSVQITRGEVRARADSAFFDRDRHVAFLLGNPNVTQRDGSLTGDTLLLHFNRTDALERLEAHGNAG